MIDTNIREKNVYINIVKGFAIFLVVLGHCIQYGSGKDYLTSLSFFDNMGFKLIYSFHMPLFMLISGGLFYHTVTRHSQREIIVSRFTKLILPLIIWNLTEIILKFIVKRNGLALSIGTFLYSFWFLWAIFWLSFIVFVVRQFFSDSLLVYIALGVVALFIPEYYNAPNYVYMYPYFIVGYFWNKRNGFEKINHLLMNLKHQVLLTVLAVLAWGGAISFFTKSTYVYVSKTNIIKNNMEWMNQLQIDLFRWIIGFMGSIAVLLCISLFKRWSASSQKMQKVGMTVSLIGAKSLGIYIISGYLTGIVLPYVTQEFGQNMLFNIMEAVSNVLFSYFATSILERNKILRKLFLGGR